MQSLVNEYLKNLEDNQNEQCTEHKKKCKALMLRQHKREEDYNIYSLATQDDTTLKSVQDFMFIGYGYCKNGTKPERSAFGAICQNKKLDIFRDHWSNLWTEVEEPAARTIRRSQTNNNRIEAITGEWDEPLGDPDEDWGSDGY